MAKETVTHEILAVEAGLAETSNRIQKETTKTLDTKRSLFTGLVKSHKLFKEEDQHLTQATEYKEVESTVQEQLDYAGSELSKYWDASLQKEEANQRAKADIIVDGKVLSKDVPVTILLAMETKLLSAQAMYNAIPTLDASKAWEPDSTYAKDNVFRTKNASERMQEIVSKDWKEVSAATVQHKAQIVQTEKRETVGKYVQYDYSGALTSIDKAQKLERLTKLIRAVKMARQRANGTVVNTKLSIGSTLIDYING